MRAQDRNPNRPALPTGGRPLEAFISRISSSPRSQPSSPNPCRLRPRRLNSSNTPALPSNLRKRPVRAWEVSLPPAVRAVATGDDPRSVAFQAAQAASSALESSPGLSEEELSRCAHQTTSHPGSGSPLHVDLQPALPFSATRFPGTSLSSALLPQEPADCRAGGSSGGGSALARAHTRCVVRARCDFILK